MTTALASLLLWAAPLGVAADPVNPHGRPGACAQCHAPTTDGSLPATIEFATGSADGACRQCHEDDPHAVGLRPERTTVPPHMLLVDDALACLTCHDEPACDGETLEPEHPGFFRGGPYARVGDLCGQCHTVTGFDRFNPHREMADSADPRELCTHCHLEVPEEGATVADLKVDGPNICLGCHMETVHAGTTRHLGPIPPMFLDDARASGLPITADARIVCLTCHDPHPGKLLGRTADLAAHVGEDLFPQRWLTDVLTPALSARGEFEARHTEPDFLRRSLIGGSLCVACHPASGIRRSSGEAP